MRMHVLLGMASCRLILYSVVGLMLTQALIRITGMHTSQSSAALWVPWYAYVLRRCAIDREPMRVSLTCADLHVAAAAQHHGVARQRLAAADCLHRQ